MAYTTRGGIFAGLDDVDPVLRGLDDVDPVLRGLGEVPPGTSDRAKKDARKTYYYLYNMAAMAPVLRKQAGIAAGVGVAAIASSIFTGGLSLLAGGAAAVGGAIAAAGTENCVMETTLWWKRSKKDRDNYIKGAMVGNDVKDVLHKSARRLDAVINGISDPVKRNRARARAYFQDFIAVGPQQALKTLNADRQAAFGAAYLNALIAGKKEDAALAAGNSAAAKEAAAQAKAVKAIQMRQVSDKVAEARRKSQTQLSEAKEKKATALDLVKKARTIVDAQKAQALVLAADQQMKIAEQQVLASAKDEQKVAAEVTVAEKEALAAQKPSDSEKIEAAAADSTEDKATDTAAEVLAPAATATNTLPDGEAPATPTQAVVQAQTAKSGGFPVVPVLVALGLGAFFFLRRKKGK